MLLIYIASDENIGLMDESCANRNIVVKQMNGSFNLQQFIISDISNLSCCQYLFIDLTCLVDNDDDLINAIVGIKSLYNFRIIILASGYESHNPILGRIFAEGIYNIITEARQNRIQEQIETCLDDGMQYKDSIKYRLQNDYSATPTKGKKQKQNKVIIQKQSIKQSISIGICGSLHRIGTTKQALHITRFLNDNGYSACYVENNTHGHLDDLDSFYNVTKSEESFFTFEEIDIYHKFDMASILAGGYDFIIYDNGLFEETNKQKFLEFDFKIITAGSLSWEAEHIKPIFSAIGNYDDIHFILPFVPTNIYHEILALMIKYKKTTHFAEYAPNLIDGITNSKIYKKIFSDYIHEKTQTLQSKKGFWKK